MKKAVSDGMPTPLSRHIPGPLTVSKVNDNLSMGGAHAWLDWCNYVSRDDETAAMRHGFNPSQIGLKVMHNTEAGTLTTIQDMPDIQRLDATTLEAFRDIMEIRGFAHHVCNLCNIHTYRKLTTLYDEALTRRVAERFRSPSLAETMKVDRDLHEEMLHFVAGGQGTMDQAIEWYVNAGKTSSSKFILLEPVVDTTPDRAAERIPSARVIDQAREGRDVSRTPRTRTDHDDSKCWSCGKAKSDHRNGRWCRGAKPSDNKQEKPSSKGKDKGKGKGKRQRTPRGSDEAREKGGPPHMSGACIESIKDNGRTFCWDFHNPKKGCRSQQCGRSHRCPAPKADGKPCDGDHAFFDHA